MKLMVQGIARDTATSVTIYYEDVESAKLAAKAMCDKYHIPVQVLMVVARIEPFAVEVPVDDL